MGNLLHETFDEEKTFIYCWNLQNVLENTTPYLTLESPTSIMFLAFHPQNSNILAGGGFNG